MDRRAPTRTYLASAPHRPERSRLVPRRRPTGRCRRTNASVASLPLAFAAERRQRWADIAMAIPDGWTDDMNIPLPEGVTAATLAEFVVSSAAAGESHDARIEKLRSWGLPPDDAELACDRALGGVFRAGTISLENEPSADKDLIAHASYRRCRANRALISAIFPKHFPATHSDRPEDQRPWWKFWG